jgi:hypothetical protein
MITAMIEDEKTVGILFGDERIGAATVEGYTDGEDEGFTATPDANLAARIAAIEDPVIRALAEDGLAALAISTFKSDTVD